MTPVDQITGVVWSSVFAPEEGRRTYRPKRYEYNRKDEDNNPKNTER